MTAGVFRRINVTLDDDRFPIFPAWTDESNWNGWAKPRFTFDVAVAVGLHVIESGMGIAAYDPDTHEFHFALLDGQDDGPMIEWTEWGTNWLTMQTERVRQIDERLETYGAVEHIAPWQIGDGWCGLEAEVDD